MSRARSSLILRTAPIIAGACVLSASTALAVPALVDPLLTAQPVASGLSQPTSMAFIGPDDFFVTEKATGQVKRVTGGVVSAPVLDLAVNSASERGLLGMALAPDFATSKHVFVYWTESTTGTDTNVAANVPLLGNRVDRFIWNGSALAFDRNLIQLRARQNDAGQPERGNHNGGPIKFGPDGKLYVMAGDVGRRGQFQNLPNGPNTSPPFVDDQFGGPAPGNAHLTGAVLRLNTDGSTPADNPFFGAGAAIGGEAGSNIQKTFAYGIRNSFGMAFDPLSASMWISENGDDSFDEINRVTPGMNSGWIQVMGPSARIAEFKDIESNEFNQSLGQDRYAPSRIADTPAEAISRMFMLPGAEYSEPEFSWKYAVAPSAVGFLSGATLGVEYDGDLFVGTTRVGLAGGDLMRFNLTPDRLHVDISADPRLADFVADNLTKFDLTESETLLFGTGFGTTTEILTGPDGMLYVLSLTDGAVYRIAPIPEPAALGLLAIAACVSCARRRRFASPRSPQPAEVDSMN